MVVLDKPDNKTIVDKHSFLVDILSDGRIVDNHCYQVKNDFLYSFNCQKQSHLQQEIGLKTKTKHHLAQLWNFISSVSSNVDDLINNDRKSTLVLFNDKNYEHNTDNSFVSVIGSNAENFTMITSNLIGYIQDKKFSLRISSRFGDSFLQYMITDTSGFLEVENIGGEKYSGDAHWFLAYLWNIQFKRSFRLGLPKEYDTQTEKSFCVRGSIDPVYFYKNKTSGKINCSFRKHNYSNPAVSLFMKAYEQIKDDYSFCHDTKSLYCSLLVANKGVKRRLKDIINTKYFTNPYYKDYNVLIDLSKRILKQKLAYFDHENDSSAFLFDVSMLFEYFVRKLIIRSGINISRKFDITPEINTNGFKKETRKLEPDIVIERSGCFHIFDVKYKNFDAAYGISREDIFQLHTYVGQFSNMKQVKVCGFIYPILDRKYISLGLDKCSGIKSTIIQQQGKNIKLNVYFLQIPNENSVDFKHLMLEYCDNFIETFKNSIA